METTTKYAIYPIDILHFYYNFLFGWQFLERIFRILLYKISVTNFIMFGLKLLHPVLFEYFKSLNLFITTWSFINVDINLAVEIDATVISVVSNNFMVIIISFHSFHESVTCTLHISYFLAISNYILRNFSNICSSTVIRFMVIRFL